MTDGTPNDWFSEVKRYLQDGMWDPALGDVPFHPDTKVPAEVRDHFKIKIEPDLAKPRRSNGTALGMNPAPLPIEQPPAEGPDDGYTAQIIEAMKAAGIELPPATIIADGNIHRFVSRPGS